MQESIANYLDEHTSPDADEVWFYSQIYNLKKNTDWGSDPDFDYIAATQYCIRCTKAWPLVFDALLRKPCRERYDLARSFLKEQHETRLSKYLEGRMLALGLGVVRDLGVGLDLMFRNADKQFQRFEAVDLTLHYKSSNHYEVAFKIAKDAAAYSEHMRFVLTQMYISGVGVNKSLSLGLKMFTNLGHENKLKVLQYLVWDVCDDDTLICFCLADNSVVAKIILARRFNLNIDVSDEQSFVAYVLDHLEWVRPLFDHYKSNYGVDYAIDALLASMGLLSGDRALEIFHKFPRINGAIREIQGAQLSMLEYLDKICTEAGSTYFLSSGALLGMVRHGFMIPWDDDIDVYMFLEDIRKIDKYLLKSNEPLYIQDFREYGRFYKFRATHSFKGWIDIFPLESVITSSDGIKISERMVVPNESDDSGVIVQYRFTDDCHPGTVKYRYFSQHDFYPPKRAVFENIQCFIPNSPESILGNGYGNYLMLPRKQKKHIPEEDITFYVRSYKRWLSAPIPGSFYLSLLKSIMSCDNPRTVSRAALVFMRIPSNIILNSKEIWDLLITWSVSDLRLFIKSLTTDYRLSPDNVVLLRIMTGFYFEHNMLNLQVYDSPAFQILLENKITWAVSECLVALLADKPPHYVPRIRDISKMNANHGSAEACAYLSMLYKYGLRVKKNNDLYLHYLSKALAGGATESMIDSLDQQFREIN